MEDSNKGCESVGHSDYNLGHNTQTKQDPYPKYKLPFNDWFHDLWPKKAGLSRKGAKENPKQNPFLPKITMVGISTEESGQMSKASLKKTMEDLTRELEKTELADVSGGDSNEYKVDYRDPLFVANVGDYYSGVAKTGSARWIRGGNN